MAAAELRHECTALDQLVQELFADLDRLRSELELKADEVEEGRRRLAERGRQLADQRKEVGRLSHQIEQQDGQLREALTELRGMREQLTREREETHLRDSQQAGALQLRLTQVEGERDELRRHLDAVQSQGGAGTGTGESMAPLLSEMAELRRHVLETRSELSGAIDRASLARSEAAPAAVGSPEEGQRYLALEHERTELESELELVRTRAVELQETVTQQKRELTEQREDLHSELKLLRQLIEQQSDLMASGGDDRHEPINLTVARPSPAATLPRPPAVSDDAPSGADPVVSSVMAQFARLQKDVAQRRQKVKK